MKHREVTLDDKYDLVEGKAYMTGIQALVRLPLDRRRIDQAAGHVGVLDRVDVDRPPVRVL